MISGVTNGDVGSVIICLNVRNIGSPTTPGEPQAFQRVLAEQVTTFYQPSSIFFLSRSSSQLPPDGEQLIITLLHSSEPKGRWKIHEPQVKYYQSTRQNYTILESHFRNVVVRVSY